MLSGGQLMAVLIVAIVMFASIVRSKHSRAAVERDPTEIAENERLRDEVRQLKERLVVLERITIEKENSLEREIERLRDQ
jgi:cell division protein FtsL